MAILRMKKVLILSTGVVSAAMLLKLSAPLILDLAPVFYSGALEWLKPPYLYLLINCIIISIVASSKLHPRSDGDDDSPHEIAPIPHPPVKVIAADFGEFDGVVSSGYGIVTVEDPTKVVEEDVIEEPFDEAIDLETRERKLLIDDEVAMVFEDSSIREVPDLPQRSDSMELIDDEIAMTTIEDSLSTEVVPDPTQRSDSMNEKPPVSSRFAHRRALKSTPEGKGLRRVTKPKRHQETLESTWRAITEGRGRPLSRHLKKSDTWHNDPNPIHDPTVKKSETFRDRGDNSTALSSSSPQVSGKPRKEPSLSQDELNRRVEAFIEKFNEEMRLQRQESLNQYQEMMMGTLK